MVKICNVKKVELKKQQGDNIMSKLITIVILEIISIWYVISRCGLLATIHRFIDKHCDYPSPIRPNADVECLRLDHMKQLLQRQIGKS